MDSVREFIPQLLTKMHVECLIHGNVKKEEALKTAELIESKLTSPNDSNKGNIIPLLPRQLILFREVSLEHGKMIIHKLIYRVFHFNRKI